MRGHFAHLIAAAALAAVLAGSAPSSATAMPVPVSTADTIGGAAPAEQVRWRGRWGWHRGWGWRGGAVAAGVIAGGLIGAAAAAPYYGYPAYGYGYPVYAHRYYAYPAYAYHPRPYFYGYAEPGAPYWATRWRGGGWR